VDRRNTPKKFESVFSTIVKAGTRRTYYFDVRRTRGDDYYITITESTKRLDDNGFERHKVFLYKEDFNRFVEALAQVVDHVKTQLMPNYDFSEFDRRHEEWDNRHESGETQHPKSEDTGHTDHPDQPSHRDDNDEMSW
jgi:hypothetical protein